MKAIALVVPVNGDCYELNLPEDSAHVVISEHIGGHFDVVRRESVVGYVHDEGLLIKLPLNARASVLFNQYLVGNCVVVGCYNDKGKFDGDDYDVPSQIVDMLKAWKLIPIKQETENE
jgi:hypothetical protein